MRLVVWVISRVSVASSLRESSVVRRGPAGGRETQAVGLKVDAEALPSDVSVGIQCSFGHSTVDNSVAPGIGRRLDGWPNWDLKCLRLHRARDRLESGR